MTKRIVDYDPISGITLWCDYDPVEDMTTVIHEFDDCEKRLDINKALQNDDEYTKRGIKESWWHYAHIPNSILHKWMVEEGINPFRKQDTARLIAKVNEREFRHLKTTTKIHVVKE